MNVSKLIVGLVAASLSFSTFAIGGGDAMDGDKVDNKKAAAVVKYKKGQKEQKKEKMAIHHHRTNQDGNRDGRRDN